METGLLVFQSDFGRFDGAVSAMHGVAATVDPSLRLYEITHQIPQYHIWEASYRLLQTIQYWPPRTVFVSVVDPGVGSERRSVVVETVQGHLIVTPDNGTLTHLKKKGLLKTARLLNAEENRLPNSSESHTFHGRDIYAYTGARLAANAITFEQVGTPVELNSIMELPTKDPTIANGQLIGMIDSIDRPFGNLWTNIDSSLFKQLVEQYGETVHVTISSNGRTIYENPLVFGRSFADLRIGEALVYINSLHNVGIAINQGSFASAYQIGIGTDWTVTMSGIQSPV
ncbi:SAM hydrolase/SAM-dependent halogenase family protein [Sporosarcina obsidiansis]|uniref:SAM hydrolase/SAM-dependent halogenase family protein n=1 Tax=Sporosarcina obsidiansis TaxID=2660748 RepID=UPI00129A20B2|nr:S-adenosyl-l-methionine hydroxide adenosyltransferase family protein [Sporosarcina obsidiansis]